MSNEYVVKGTDRQAGAIGAHEGFTQRVFAKTPEEAIESVREQRYAANREHVFTRLVYKDDGGNVRCVWPERVATGENCIGVSMVMATTKDGKKIVQPV